MYCYNCMNEKGRARDCPVCGLDHSMEAAAHHLRPGTTLSSKYVIGYAIGEGGFGITYIGRDTTLDLRVAVKEYYPSGYANRSHNVDNSVSVTPKQRDFFEKGKARFLFEARNIAKFGDEPGIVNVRDFFEENGTAYIIMEYLDGVDLNRRLNTDGPMPAADAFRLMLPVMRSLERIHAAGIIHRDISPDNIMVLKDGSLRLTDFGSARYFNTAETEMSVMLKEGYAPEEQYRKNGEQGPWTDVYGLCATLYKMMTGQVPEDGLDRLHEDHLIPPSALGAEISPALEKVLLYGLAVFHENRCQTMGELISLTNRALMNQPVRVTPAMPSDLNAHRTIDAGYREAATRAVNTAGYGDSYSDAVGQDADIAPARQDRPRKEKPKKSLLVLILIGAAALVVIGAVVAAVLLSGSGQSQPLPTEQTATAEPTEAPTEAATEAPTEKTTDAPTEKPTEAPTEAKIRVTDVSGLKLDRAMAILREQGFEVAVEYIDSDKRLNYVVRQSPEAYEELSKGETVTLFIPEERETEPPTEATENPNAYIVISSGAVWLYQTPSRDSDHYDMTVGRGEEVEVTGSAAGEFVPVRFNGVDGYILSRFLVPKKDAATASAVSDREYHDALVCLNDVILYDDTTFTKGELITKGEEALQVGYCPASGEISTDYYEIYYNERVYYLPFAMLHDNFEYVNQW